MIRPGRTAMSAPLGRHRRPTSSLRSRIGAPAMVLLATLGVVGVVTFNASSASASVGFTAGNLVVYRVGTGTGALSSSGSAVALDEFSTSGASVSSVTLPSVASGANKPLVASGSANSEGMLTLSADGRYLVATGYSAAVGATGLSSSASASVPRTVARVDALGNVDTTTALTDFSDGNNPRSAISLDGSSFWVAGAASSLRYAALGATTSTALTNSTYKNLRQLQIANGQLYASADPTKASVTVASIGTGLPTSGTQTPTNIPFTTAPTQPFGYAFVTLGSGSASDTLYVADNGAGVVAKYTLTSGHWASSGSVAVSNVTGLAANDSNGTVSIFATASGSAGTSGSLYKITDSSGLGGTLSGSAALIATAPANEAYRGVAFAPGTVFGSGGGTPVNNPPTITADHGGLAAAINDPTNPSLGLTVGDSTYSAAQLTVTATSSNQAVAANAGISISGTGAQRVLTIAPAGVGNSLITLTVTAPDSTQTTTQIRYGVSADLGQPSARYYSGAGNGSVAIDVGGGYMIVGDDENNVLRLYQEGHSGAPVRTFDFTALLPSGTTEVDIEAAARSGNTVYWTGSMSNTSSGNLAPSRSTIFATQITGSGAATTLSYGGSYTGLLSDLVAWDHNNGHGLGADYLGLAASSASGVDGHANNALNVEGMEFAGNSTSTAYLSFRAPLEPTTNRHLAMLVPVTNIPAITSAGNPGSVHATFGAPIFLDLGGLGVRDIRENGDGQYLISAGTADDSNSSFVLYQWDGVAADAPRRTGTTLPQLPSATNQGSWETIVSVPEPLVAGSDLQLIQDDGDVVWYNDGLTSKTGMAADLQKSMGLTLSYTAPTSTAVSTDSSPGVVGQAVTFSAQVSAPTGAGTPTGSVTFSGQGGVLCSAVAVDGSGTATCTTSYPTPGSDSVSAVYSGGGGFAGSTGTVAQSVAKASTSTVLVTAPAHPVVGQPVTYTATVAVTAPGAGVPTGTVTFTGASGPLCTAAPLNGTSPDTASCTTTYTAAQTDSVSAAYSGDSRYLTSADSTSQPVASAATTTTTVVSPDAPVVGQSVTYSATVDVVAPGSGRPTGTVSFTGAAGVICAAAPLAGTGPVTATCTTSYAAAQTDSVTAAYSGDGGFAASTSTLPVTIHHAQTAITLDGPDSVIVGQPVTLTAQLSVTAPGAGVPTGSVDFSVGGVALTGCTNLPVPTTAPFTFSCTTSALPHGTDVVNVAYAGDSGFDASSAQHTVAAGFGPTADISLTPATATIVGGSQVAYHVTGHDSSGNDLGDITAATTLSITPDGVCSAGSCSAAIPGVHTVTAVNGAASATATLNVTQGHSDDVVENVVGIGDHLSQYGFDFVTNGDDQNNIGVNFGIHTGQLASFDATADFDGRTLYQPGSTSQNPQELTPTVVTKSGTVPVARVSSSESGIAALLGDTASPERVHFVRSTELPTAADQAAAAAAGWGGLRVVRVATGAVSVAVSGTATNAPAGLSAAELVNIYNGTYQTWGDLPGYSGPSPTSPIVPLLPEAGSDTRLLFDADLAAANAGAPVHYSSHVQVVGDDDYTAVTSAADAKDVIYPFSSAQLSMIARGYFGPDVQAGISGLAGSAPDGAVSYHAAHPIYVVLRDSDVASTSPWRGSTKNWAQLLFIGPQSSFGSVRVIAPLTAAGLVRSYADLGDASR
ncbi:Protein of unknown function [Frankineae bacterium MT45]|nr:Protein of unknown function [Frankineae bacterium MT45]